MQEGVIAQMKGGRVERWKVVGGRMVMQSYSRVKQGLKAKIGGENGKNITEEMNIGGSGKR